MTVPLPGPSLPPAVSATELFGAVAGDAFDEHALALAEQSAGIGIWSIDLATGLARGTAQFFRIMGLEPASRPIPIEAVRALRHPDDRERVLTGFRRALEDGTDLYEIEYRIIRPDGETRWIFGRGRVIRDVDGKPVRYSGVDLDITARKALEAARVELLDAEREARATAEAARHQFELLATAGADLSRSLESQETLQTIARTIVPGIADYCRVDLLDGDGVLRRALTHHSDPEKTRAATELVQRLRAAPDTPGSMAWAVATGESRLCQFDPPRQFDSIKDRDLLSFADAIGMRAYFIVPLIARGHTLGALAALQADSGRSFDPDSCALIVAVAQRAALALDNARLYADAEAALLRAKSASEAKDDFLAMLGHELRNPLAPITLALHLMDLRNEPGSANERAIIRRQVAHLSRLIDDLHDVSRIAKGKISLKCEQTDLRTVVDEALEMTRPMFDGRSRPLELDLPPSPVHVWGDPVRLAQALSNLLTNAAKFTPEDGRIALRMSVPDERVVELAVEDAGAGISTDLLPYIFDVFVQGRQPIDRAAGGMGLGLAIVKSLVQMHGGDVRATSEGIGRGSTFALRLPLFRATMGAVDAHADPATSESAGGRILVVDDNVDAAETLAEVLRVFGYDARAEIDAHAALAAVEVFAADAAVLDIGLPGVDGYELARRMKSDPRLPNVKLIALSGYGSETDRARALAAGFDEHLVKPLEPERLLDTIKRLLESRGK